MAKLALAMALAVATEVPTQEGDLIGTARMAEKGHIILQLRTVECGGAISEGILEVAPDQPSYGDTLAWVGGIRPGETKPLFARNLSPCDLG